MSPNEKSHVHRINPQTEAIDAWISSRAIDHIDVMIEGVTAAIFDGQWYTVWVEAPSMQSSETVQDGCCSCPADDCWHIAAVKTLLAPLLAVVALDNIPHWDFWNQARFSADFGAGTTMLRDQLQLLANETRRAAWTEAAYYAYETTKMRG